jgi:hypothetical protein
LFYANVRLFFEFMPSGAVVAMDSIRTFKLDLYKESFGTSLLAMEVIVVVFVAFFICSPFPPPPRDVSGFNLYLMIKDGPRQCLRRC